MGDQRKPLTDGERISRLERELEDAKRSINRMLLVGGFADSKTLSTRCGHAERRLELLELDSEMLKDVAAMSSDLVHHHLFDRHDADVDRDGAPDVVPWRRIRKRMREWAEKRGLMTKRKDLTDARKDEGRLRPRMATA